MSQYFNQQGNTFAYEKLATYFSIICSEGIAVESKCEYYSDNFQMVDKSYQFTDEYKKDLAKENCEPPVNTPYIVIKNLNEYMGKKNIKLAK
jgi:hypothetical protein